MGRTIENGVIDWTQLGYMDRGILTFWISVKMNGTGQGFGGYALDEWAGRETCNTSEDRRKHSAAAGMLIESVLNAVGVEKWEDLEGKHVRVDHDWTKVFRIGHIIEDKWCDPEILFANVKDGMVPK